MKYSIALIIPYFGRFNNYFDLFIESCKYNPTVDFLFFSDDERYLDKSNYASNIKFFKSDFTLLHNRIQSFYDFPIYLKTPYDLVNFKPAYGEIFKEELKQYDFWGYCDCDMIFGDIRHFITDEILDSYSKILMRGHFTLFRNVDAVNTIYRNPLKDGRLRYKEVFSSNKISHFDEGLYHIDGINTLFIDAKTNIFDKYIFYDVEVSKYAFRQADFLMDDKEMCKEEKSVFEWKDGKLYMYYQENGNILREEYMYIHLQKRKMKNKVDSPNLGFHIRPNVFVPLHKLDISYIANSNKDKFYFDYFLMRLKRKIKKLI